MKILVGMPAKDSWGGPISSEPPFVEALRSLGEDVTEETYVYGDKGKPIPVHQRVFRVIQTALRFRKIFSKRNFDIVHLNTAFDLNTILRDAFSIFAMRPGKAKIFLKIHGSETARFGSSNLVINLLIRYLIRRVDGFGIFTREEMAGFRRLGVPASKLFIVKNAIFIAAPLDSRAIGPELDTERMNLLFVSRFIRAKGLLETIKACAILRNEGLDFVLNCVGDGETREEAGTLVETLDLTDRVVFTGYIAEESVTEYLVNSDVLVFPTSHIEGFPIVLFKAMAAGLPMVTTRIRAAADYLSDPENCLFCTNDPQDIAMKLDRLIKNSELRTEMSKRNIEFARLLEPRPIAEEFMAIYRELLKQ